MEITFAEDDWFSQLTIIALCKIFRSIPNILDIVFIKDNGWFIITFRPVSCKCLTVELQWFRYICMLSRNWYLSRCPLTQVRLWPALQLQVRSSLIRCSLATLRELYSRGTILTFWSKLGFYHKCTLVAQLELGEWDLSTILSTGNCQFGFKEGHGTEMSRFALKQTVDHYRSKNSSIFLCIFDARKAFDRVYHWTMFRKLIERGASPHIVQLLVLWYRWVELLSQ